MNGAQVRDPFPNQQIPQTLRMSSPCLLAVQNYFPHPTSTGNLTNNYAIPSYSNFSHDTNMVGSRLDHSISPTIKISGYLSRLMQNSPNANGLDYIASAPAPTSNRNVTARFNYDQTLRPTMLLHVGIGYIWQRQPTDTPTFDQSTLGLQGYPDSDRFPSIGAFAVGDTRQA